MQQRSETTEPVRRGRLRRVALGSLLLVGIALAGAAGVAYQRLHASLPILEGTLDAPGLAHPAELERDAQGVATLRAGTRADLAYALGIAHGQERFFAMDTNRRLAAGELAELVGGFALPLDRRNRVHRFRARARALVAAMPAGDRAVLDAYVAGVNRGLEALDARPYPYLMLRTVPQPWQAEDTILTVFAMYFNLQEADGWSERRRALTEAALGRELSDFLYPDGSRWDAAMDGSQLPEPPMPAAAAGGAPGRQGGLELDPLADAMPGSNAWAVGGALTRSGAALVANDMHLGLRVPNVWYRARLQAAPGTPDELDVTGVTLPGAPIVVAGSNGRVAWGFTNAYIDTGDLVVLEPVADDPDAYRTPDGPRRLEVREENLCVNGGECSVLRVEESVWGPVIGTAPDGRRLAYRWVAHDPDAVALGPFLELERAGTTAEALVLGRRAGMPAQNMVAGDRDGRVGWTLTGPLPRRVGIDGRRPESWADGSRRWDGRLPPEQVPAIVDPADGLIWTANQRVVGGEAFARIGSGGYGLGARAGQIRDALRARDRFTEADMLAIQLDDRAVMLAPWQELLMAELRKRGSEPRFAVLAGPVDGWGGRATVDSVGYRLVRTFRDATLAAIYDAWTAPLRKEAPEGTGNSLARRFTSLQAEQPVWRLLTERPAGLVPPGYKDWDGVIQAALDETMARLDQAGGLEAFTWGARNHAGIHSPLTQALPFLRPLIDPPDEPLPGDTLQPRVQGPGFGASERFAVSPGREAEGIFMMPVGQSDHPLSPYYLAGHEDWAKGRAAPFLPGPKAWSLRLEPRN